MQERLYWNDVDDNFNALLHYSGSWNATDSFTVNELVRHEGGLWICLVDNTGVEPSLPLIPQWIPLIYPGSGSVNQTATQVIGTLADWTPIEFDAEPFTPYGCSFDLANDTYKLDFAGIWQEALTLFIEHNEANQSRRVAVRLWNTTDSVSLGEVQVGIGRNTDASSITVVLANRFAAADLADVLQWQIGPSVGSVADVDVTAMIFNLVQQSV